MGMSADDDKELGEKGTVLKMVMTMSRWMMLRPAIGMTQLWS
jgi:hypothetical protein